MKHSPSIPPYVLPETVDFLTSNWLFGYYPEVDMTETAVFVHHVKNVMANTTCHRHDFYELAVVLSGRGYYAYQGNCYELSAGDAYILPPGVIHQYYEQKYLEVVNFLWYPERMKAEFQALEEIPAFRLFFDLEPKSRNFFQFEHRLVLTPEQLAEVRMYELRMRRELENREEGYALRLNWLMCDLLLILSRYYNKSQGNNPANELMRLNNVLQYMEKHLGEPLSRGQIAKQFGSGEQYFAKRFREIMSETYSDYLQKIRLRHVQNLLQTTELSLTEIARKCGFCDSNYLCYVFRKKYGIPPHQYRLHGGNKMDDNS